MKAVGAAVGKDTEMQVTLRIAGRNAAPVIDRLMGCVLLVKELPSVKYLVGGFYFDTERSPMLILAALEEEGFHFDDFDCISFEH